MSEQPTRESANMDAAKLCCTCKHVSVTGNVQGLWRECDLLSDGPRWGMGGNALPHKGAVGLGDSRAYIYERSGCGLWEQDNE